MRIVTYSENVEHCYFKIIYTNETRGIFIFIFSEMSMSLSIEQLFSQLNFSIGLFQYDYFCIWKCFILKSNWTAIKRVKNESEMNISKAKEIFIEKFSNSELMHNSFHIRAIYKIQNISNFKWTISYSCLPIITEYLQSNQRKSNFELIKSFSYGFITEHKK